MLLFHFGMQWNMLSSILMESVLLLHFSMLHTAQCHSSVNLVTVGIHLTTLLNILMSRNQQTHLTAKCHKVALTVKLLDISVTWHMSPEQGT